MTAVAHVKCEGAMYVRAIRAHKILAGDQRVLAAVRRGVVIRGEGAALVDVLCDRLGVSRAVGYKLLRAVLDESGVGEYVRERSAA
jgi:hypothetical protein